MSLLKPNPFNNITVCNVAFSQSDINARRLMSESVALNRVHSSNDGITILNCISSARWTERSAGGGEITVSVLLTRLSHAHLTRIVHVLYKGKTEALTQVPQGIDGLWLGRPGSVLPRLAGFLSGAQHVWNTRFIISLWLAPLPLSSLERGGAASLGRGYTAQGLARGSHADPGHLERLGGLGAPRAAPHAFYHGGGGGG